MKSLFFAFLVFGATLLGCKSSTQSQTTWTVGKKLEVQWKNSWYKATILEVKDGKYKIHYDGYGDNWDEWVNETRMRKAK